MTAWQIVARTWAAKAEQLEPDNLRLRRIVERGIRLMEPALDRDDCPHRVEDWVMDAQEALDART